MQPPGLTNGVVAYRWHGDLDAIDVYSRRLVSALNESGVSTRYAADGLSSVLGATGDPAWVLVQYNPFRWGGSGFAPALVRDVCRLRGARRLPVALMIHEAWIDMNGAKSIVIGLWQRAQLRALARVSDRVMTSTAALAAKIGGGAVHVPVASNITPIDTSHADARLGLGIDRPLIVTLFGRGHPSRALDYAHTAIDALTRAHGADALAVLNLGAGAPALTVPPHVEVHSPGPLPEEDLSLRLWASDLVLLPFTDGVSTRRTTLMAALAHGRPVLALRGHDSDPVLTEADEALVLTPVGDRAAFAERAVQLTVDPARLQSIGDAGRRLYEARFDWPVLADRLRGLLQPLTCEPSLEPVAT